MSCYILMISPQQRNVLVNVLRASPAVEMPDDVHPIDTHAFADMLADMRLSYAKTPPEKGDEVLNGLCL